MMNVLEVCCGSLQSVAAAVEGGAQRIELCSALSLDGLTPSIGLLSLVHELYPALTIHVLVRPREGNFVYSRLEVRLMERDIRAALPYADGIVVGTLTAEGDIDLAAMACLMQAAEDRPVTFHRAFDVCRQPLVALEQIIALGCRRILTSGQQPRAEEGIALLRQLRDLSDGRLIIMPGGGVNTNNARLILDQVGTTEIHGSCSGGTGVTDAAVVRQILSSLES
ncbi:MAG: copper homeostasis protein CutC [Prevotella sp.]|nr:copper homeostasis protein CutC [Prevotella sp.]